MSNLHLYTSMDKKWREAYESAIIDYEDLGITRVENGIVLPLRPLPSKELFPRKMYFAGGVCTDTFEFVAGFKRNLTTKQANLSCNRAYTYNGPIPFQDETVIFAGVLFDHFGHLLIDGLLRIWYAIEHQEYKIAVVYNIQGDFPFHEYFELLNINSDNCYIIKEPIQFKCVIVPDEAAYTLAMRANIKWKVHYDYMRNNAKSKKSYNIDKIYLTRTKLPRNDGINEEYFENFYKSIGYEIIAPETYPLSDQIAMISNAKQIACTIGTLSHFVLFAQENCHLDLLLRDPHEIVRQQLLANKLRNIDCNIIEVTKNFLPVHHVGGTFLYAPTKFFEQFCKDNGYQYQKINNKKLCKDYIYDYLVKYTKNYNNPQFFQAIRNKTSFDLLYELNFALFGKKISKKAFAFFDFVKGYQALQNDFDTLSASLAFPGLPKITYFLFFYEIGWIPSTDPTFAQLQKGYLQAIKLSSQFLIRYHVYLADQGWLSSETNQNGVCGSLDEDFIQAVAFEFVDFQPNLSLRYRVYLEESGWTNFSCDGEPCGNPSLDSVDFSLVHILGLQLFIEEKQMI